jgi:hypothetical protein
MAYFIQIPMSQKTYDLTRQVLAEEIDTEENLTGTTERFNPGTRFTIIHEPHVWGITRTEHCTVQVDGKLYNILARVLNASMREVE